MAHSADATEENELRSAELASTVQLAEVLIFLALVVPSTVLSLLALQRSGASFTLTAAATIVRDLALVALIRYFIWRKGEPVRRLGWTARDLGTNILLGVGLFIPFTVTAGLLELGLRSAGLSAPPTPSFLIPQGAAQLVLAVILVAVVAFAEETIFRGYLILRLNSVTGSLAAAVVLSTGIFALGHGYEGTAGVATVAYMGAAFALIYIWRRSLVAPMVMHFLQDLLGLVLVPLIGLR